MMQSSEHYNTPYDRSFNHFFRELSSFPCRLSTFVLYYNFESFSFIQIWHQQSFTAVTDNSYARTNSPPRKNHPKQILHCCHHITIMHLPTIRHHMQECLVETRVYDFCLKEKKMV
jgi:hypothetical protein